MLLPSETRSVTEIERAQIICTTICHLYLSNTQSQIGLGLENDVRLAKINLISNSLIGIRMADLAGKRCIENRGYGSTNTIRLERATVFPSPVKCIEGSADGPFFLRLEDHYCKRIL